MKTIIQFLNGKLLSVVLIIFFCAAIFSSCSKNDDNDMEQVTTVKYSGTFEKSKDGVVTTASGISNVTFDMNTLMLSYTINWNGLGSNAVNMHFHDSGPVIAEITGFSSSTSGSVSGTASLTSTQASDLAAGKIYVQIHTENYPAGEVIAVLTKSTSSPSGSTGGGGY